jgi:FkbM family methyltransferase
MIAHRATCLPWFSYDAPATLCGDKSRIVEAFRLLHDEGSRRVFIGSLRFRGLADLTVLNDEDGDDQYFPAGVFKPLAEESLVDCGAYDGDTLQSFVSRYGASGCKAYFGFEPDPDSFNRLTKRCDDIGFAPERIILKNAATWGRNEVLRFAADATMMSHITKAEGTNVEAVALDIALVETAPSFITLDVEGAEAEMLLGAQSLIKSHSPVIAACVYHKPHDLSELPRLIRDLNPSYTFFLRNHGCGGFELALYAVPKHRLTGAV